MRTDPPILKSGLGRIRPRSRAKITPAISARSAPDHESILREAGLVEGASATACRGARSPVSGNAERPRRPDLGASTFTPHSRAGTPAGMPARPGLSPCASPPRKSLRPSAADPSRGGGLSAPRLPRDTVNSAAGGTSRGRSRERGPSPTRKMSKRLPRGAQRASLADIVIVSLHCTKRREPIVARGFHSDLARAVVDAGRMCSLVTAALLRGIEITKANDLLRLSNFIFRTKRCCGSPKTATSNTRSAPTHSRQTI